MPCHEGPTRPNPEPETQQPSALCLPDDDNYYCHTHQPGSQKVSQSSNDVQSALKHSKISKSTARVSLKMACSTACSADPVDALLLSLPPLSSVLPSPFLPFLPSLLASRFLPAFLPSLLLPLLSVLSSLRVLPCVLPSLLAFSPTARFSLFLDPDFVLRSPTATAATTTRTTSRSTTSTPCTRCFNILHRRCLHGASDTSAENLLHARAKQGCDQQRLSQRYFCQTPSIRQ